MIPSVCKPRCQFRHKHFPYFCSSHRIIIIFTFFDIFFFIGSVSNFKRLKFFVLFYSAKASLHFDHCDEWTKKKYDEKWRLFRKTNHIKVKLQEKKSDLEKNIFNLATLKILSQFPFFFSFPQTEYLKYFRCVKINTYTHKFEVTIAFRYFIFFLRT